MNCLLPFILMFQAPPHNFWDISLANIVTWAILIIGFVASQYVIVKLQGQRLNGHDEALKEFKSWMKQHQSESNKRDQIQERLTTLQEVAERRLEKLEEGDRRRAIYTRSESPEPYYGEERRGRKP